MSRYTPEQIAQFHQTARQQQAQEQADLVRREELAWEAARLAAKTLREQFGVTRVALFGSLTRPGTFTRWSDVDLAAWGIPVTDTVKAIGSVMDLRTEVPVNLVDVNCCKPSILTTIEQDGVDL